MEREAEDLARRTETRADSQPDRKGITTERNGDEECLDDVQFLSDDPRAAVDTP